MEVKSLEEETEGKGNYIWHFQEWFITGVSKL